MKKFLITPIFFAVFLIAVSIPVFAQNVNTGGITATGDANAQLLQELQLKIQQLQAQINDLLRQVEVLSGKKTKTNIAPTPDVCTQEYDPVCGSDDKTYSNSCMASLSKVSVSYKGECQTSVSATGLNVFNAPLQSGSRGEAVSNLQNALRSDPSIYPEGLVTGYFGPFTKNAVGRFQEKYNIISGGDANTTGYGMVGPKTNAMLNALFGAQKASPFSNIQPSSQSQNPFLATSTALIVTDCSQEKNDLAKDACWQSKAVENKDTALCANIKNSNLFVSKNSCLNLVAQIKKDKTICASITDLNIKKNCEETIK